MMDDLLKRGLQTIAFIVFAMLLIYGLIATGSEKPAMLTLVYFNFMNRIFAFIWWLIKMIVLVGSIIATAFLYFGYKKDKKNELEAKELKLRGVLSDRTLTRQVDSRCNPTDH